MKTNTRLAFPLATIAAALLSAYGSAWAEDSDEMKAFTKSESSVRIGAGYLTDDAPRFGQYTGVRDTGSYGLLDVDIVKRNDETGTWFKVEGRNLGLDNRDLRVSHERQGDWGYSFDYSKTPRFEPLTVNTGLTGIGTTTQTHNANPAARRNVELSTEREAFGLGFNKQLGGGFDFQLRARTEQKDGSRLWGHGPGTADFLTEPINSTTRQVEGILGYGGEKLHVSAGYYVTSYTNQNASVTAIGSTAGSPFVSALPQDNESHQFYVSGGYAFTPSTHGTFKASLTHAIQNENFFTAPTRPAAVSHTSLNGVLDTTLLQMGITSQPMPKLSLLANLRYEDRDDKTPRFQYLDAAASRDGFNVPLSRSQLTGKLEASYQLPMAYRLTGGVDVENIKRTVTPTLRQISWREKNDETSYRLELRRSLSDTLNGAVSYVHSNRGGSPYLAANNNGAADVIDPIHWADRKRDKVRVATDWMPADALSLQFVVEAGNDTYDGRPLGPESGKVRVYSIDAAYTFSEAWQATAWVSRDENQMDQATITGANGAIVPAGVWQAHLKNNGNSIGFGVRGKPSEKVQVGADLQYSRDVNKYGLTSLSPSTGSLPDINNKVTTLKLFGTYALQKNSSVRLDYIFDRRTTDDWTWTGWTYADGTTVTQNPNQKVHFIGASYIYTFQ